MLPRREISVFDVPRELQSNYFSEQPAKAARDNFVARPPDLSDIDANFLHYVNKAARVATCSITFKCLLNCVSLMLCTRRVHVVGNDKYNLVILAKIKYYTTRRTFSCRVSRTVANCNVYVPLIKTRTRGERTPRFLSRNIDKTTFTSQPIREIRFLRIRARTLETLLG